MWQKNCCFSTLCTLCTFPILRSTNKNVCNREEIIYLELYNFCVLFMTHFSEIGAKATQTHYSDFMMFANLRANGMRLLLLFFFGRTATFDLFHFSFKFIPPLIEFYFYCYESRLLLISSRSLPIEIQNFKYFII